MAEKSFRSYAAKLCAWVLMLSLSVSFPCTTTSAKHIDSKLRWPHEKSDLRPDPALVFGGLPNGFRYVLMENRKPKNRVSMHLNVQAGSLHESDKQQGLAHFLEHMLFDGSTHFKPGELVKYFQSIGMEFGPDANAHTGFHQTVYDILLPEGSGESLEKGLMVIKDYAEGALLLQSEIDRERKVVLAEKRSRDSVSYRTFISTLMFEFPEARISKRLPIGKEDVLRTAHRASFKDFYDTWYRPGKMILVMVGDFDSSLAASLIEDNFSALSPRAPPESEPDIGTINHRGVEAFYHFEKEAGNTTVTIEVLKKVQKEPDSLAFQRRWLKKSIADRIVMDRLNTLVSKPDTPFTSASIGSGIFSHEIKYAQITADCSPENWEKSLPLLEQILRKAIQYGFTESELERVKKDYLSELDTAVNKASTRNSSDLARGIIRNLNSNRVFQSPRQERELFTPLIQRLTLKDVYDYFKKTWAPEHRLVLVTGNVNLTGTDAVPEAKILRVFNKSSKVGVSRPVEIKSAVFPYLPEPEKKGRVINRTHIPDLDFTQVDFENGVRLNLKKTDFEADEVLVNLAFGRGRSTEPVNLPGLADLSAEVVNESGLGKLEKDEMNRAMAGKNTTVRFDVGEDRFFFKGQTVSKEASLLFQLIYAHLIDPGYREDAYSLTMERFVQRYQALSRSIDGAIKLSGARFLAGGDSRFGLPAYEKFKELTLDHVRSWIDPALKYERLEVSVVGDVDVDSVINLAATYLGSLPPKPGIEIGKDSRRPVFPAARSLKIAVATEIPKGLVIVAFPTEDFWNIQRTRRFSALAAIFSDRLRIRVREKLGAAYSPFAYNRSSRAYPGYGVFQAFVHVDPEQSDKVVDEVKKISIDLAKNGVTQDELVRAIEPMLTGIKDMRRTNNYWLNSVLSGSTDHPRQLDWSRTILNDYASITVAEVSRLASQYLDTSKTATIIVKPERRD